MDEMARDNANDLCKLKTPRACIIKTKGLCGQRHQSAEQVCIMYVCIYLLFIHPSLHCGYFSQGGFVGGGESVL